MVTTTSGAQFNFYTANRLKMEQKTHIYVLYLHNIQKNVRISISGGFYT